MFNVFITSRADFVAKFTTPVLGTVDAPLRDFLSNFPKLSRDASKGEILGYLGTVCRYCAGQGVFTPPPHTYTHSDFVVGAWYRHLPPIFQNNFEYYDHSLASALTGKYSGLKDCEAMADLIHY